MEKTSMEYGLGIKAGLRDAIAYTRGDKTRGTETVVNVLRKWWPRNAQHEGFNGIDGGSDE